MDPAQQTSRLIVYGHNYCPQSRLLLAALNDRHIDHEWRDIVEGEPHYKDELRQLARGNLSVPTVIFPDGTVLVEPWPQDVLARLEPPGRDLLARLRNRWLRLS